MVSRDSSPTGPARRFGCLIGQLKQAIAAGIGRDHATLGPLAVILWNYLARSLRRFAALQARYEAGTLHVSPSPRASVERGAPPTPARPAPPRLPRGAVLARFNAAHLCPVLRRFVEEPETQALLAAAPEIGRLLRPLWRMLTRDELPEGLRLPPRPKRKPAANAESADAPASSAPLLPASFRKERRGVSVPAYLGGRRRRPFSLA